MMSSENPLRTLGSMPEGRHFGMLEGTFPSQHPDQGRRRISKI